MLCPLLGCIHDSCAHEQGTEEAVLAVACQSSKLMDAWDPLQVHGMTGSKLYGKKSGADYTDNQWRFKLLAQAALEALVCLPFSPGEQAVVVCNDWHTALLPVLLKVGHSIHDCALTLAVSTGLISINATFSSKLCACKHLESEH